jgi:hypothetical protein
VCARVVGARLIESVAARHIRQRIVARLTLSGRPSSCQCGRGCKTGSHAAA